MYGPSPGSRSSAPRSRRGAALGRLAENSVDLDEDGSVGISGHDVTDAIRQAEIDRLVPIVARHPEVRTVMRTRQRELAELGNAVIEGGRDIGTVVAPDADVKVYLNADPEIRAQRRRSGRTSAVTPWRRIFVSATSDAARMQPAEDATQIDTTELDVEDVVDRIERLVRARV